MKKLINTVLGTAITRPMAYFPILFTLYPIVLQIENSPDSSLVALTIVIRTLTAFLYLGLLAHYLVNLYQDKQLEKELK